MQTVFDINENYRHYPLIEVALKVPQESLNNLPFFKFEISKTWTDLIHVKKWKLVPLHAAGDS